MARVKNLAMAALQEGWKRERKFQRCECDLNARYCLAGKWRGAKVITISAGGVFLACHPLKIVPNDLVDLVIELEGQVLPSISRVVWVNARKSKGRTEFPYPPGFAAAFEKIDSTARAEIDHFVKRSLRALRALVHELEAENPDREKINHLFLQVRPNDSIRLNHIRKTVREEIRYFRLRKLDTL